MLMEDYKPSEKKEAITIGIPRALMVFYQQFPFWRTFFEELGFNVVISRETDKKLVTKSLETVTTETCLPVELMHGHVVDLIEQKVDYVFLPFIVDAKAKPGNPTSNYQLSLGANSCIHGKSGVAVIGSRKDDPDSRASFQAFQNCTSQRIGRIFS